MTIVCHETIPKPNPKPKPKLNLNSKRLEETSDKKMSYYAIELDAGARKELTKLAVTAQQLFVMRVELPSAQDAALVNMSKQALASFQVKPNYLENFQGVNGEKVVGQAPELGDYFKRIPKDILQVESGDF